jgi:hypothetical protein
MAVSKQDREVTREVGPIGIWGFLIRRSTTSSFNILTTRLATKGGMTNNLMRTRRGVSSFRLLSQSIL